MIVDSLGITLLLSIFAVLVLLRVPITFCLAISAIVTGIYLNLPLEAIVKVMADGVMNFSLLAIPFFIIMGEIMNEGGIAQRIVNLANLFVGRLPGGLALVNVLDSMFFGGISGSAVADVSSLGSIVIPMMKKQGYDPEFSVGLTVCSACQGIIIPPSHNMIIYAFAVGTASQLAGGQLLVVSVGKLFLGGYIPGILMGVMMLIISLVIAIRKKYPRGKGYSFREGLFIFLDGLLALCTALIVVGGVIIGIFTATEAAAFAVLYAFIITFFVYREAPSGQVCEDSLCFLEDPRHCDEPDRCGQRLWISTFQAPGSEARHGVAPLDHKQLLPVAVAREFYASRLGLHHGYGSFDPDLHPHPFSSPRPEDGNGPDPLRDHAALESLHRPLHASRWLCPFCGKRGRKNPHRAGGKGVPPLLHLHVLDALACHLHTCDYPHPPQPAHAREIRVYRGEGGPEEIRVLFIPSLLQNIANYSSSKDAKCD
jgi:hypothetical protein